MGVTTIRTTAKIVRLTLLLSSAAQARNVVSPAGVPAENPRVSGSIPSPHHMNQVIARYRINQRRTQASRHPFGAAAQARRDMLVYLERARSNAVHSLNESAPP